MSDGNLLPGQQYDSNKDLIIPFTEQMRDRNGANQDLGDPRTEVTPNDYNSFKVRKYSVPTGIDDLVISGPSNANLQLPDVLTSISVVYNQNIAEGNSVEDNQSFSGGDHRDLTVALNGSAQSSLQIIPELNIQITSYWAHNIPSMRYFFYMTGPVTLAALLTRLGTITGSTVNALPTFKPQSHTMLLKGQGVSVRAEAKVRQFDYLSQTYAAYSLDTGSGSNFSTETSFRIVQLPPTLHGSITIATPLQENNVAATATATIVGGVNFPFQQVQSHVVSPIQRATVTPSSLSPTSPSAIPTTGLYLVDRGFESALEWGRTLVFAEVVDFSVFA